MGSRSYDVALAVFTGAPHLPGRPGVVVLLTNRGAYLRRTDGLVSAGRTEPRAPAALRRELADLAVGEATVYVTAEANVPLAEVAAALAAVPVGAAVALGVALGAEVRVPDPPPPAAERPTGLCPAGLGAAERSPPGQLEPALIVGALGPLRAAARSCMAESGGMRAAGGRLELMMRIGANGAVERACLLTDEVGGAALRDCLVRAAEATRFPRPQPAGHVDVSLPLVLRPTVQRPVCDAAAGPASRAAP
jgi:hypothetical protein